MVVDWLSQLYIRHLWSADKNILSHVGRQWLGTTRKILVTRADVKKGAVGERP